MNQGECSVKKLKMIRIKINSKIKMMMKMKMKNKMNKKWRRKRINRLQIRIILRKYVMRKILVIR